MIKMIFIDTDLIIKYMQKRNTALHKKAISILEKLWINEESIGITEYNYAELLRGAYLSAKVGFNLKIVSDICTKFEIIYSDTNSIHEYAQISANLRLKGENISELDELIASIVISKNGTLYTHNLDHYSRIISLTIVDWGN